MTSDRWDRPGIPHKGWRCVGLEDLNPNNDPADEVEYAQCQMCGREQIRYVHIMKHNETGQELSVGTICAEKMSEDYVGPKKREREIINRMRRQKTFMNRTWRISKAGYPYIINKGRRLGVCLDKKTGKFIGYCGGGFDAPRFGSKLCQSVDEAKLAVFDEFYDPVSFKEE